MDDNKIKSIIKDGKLLWLRNNKSEFFLYYNKYNVLIPIQQDDIKNEYEINYYSSRLYIQLGSISCRRSLIKDGQAKELFVKLEKIAEINSWELTSKFWFVDKYEQTFEKGYRVATPIQNLVYNGLRCKTEHLGPTQKAHILWVIYLPGKKIVEGDRVNWDELSKYGLMVCESVSNFKTQCNDKKSVKKISREISCVRSPKTNEATVHINKDDNISLDIQELLDCDKKRCGLASYEREMLYDIKAGHWAVFENSDLCKMQDKGLIARDPRLDIKKNGVIGIDFGTKSTVVVKQEGSNEIRPIRIGSLSLKADVSESDYENPTIISCTNINNFLMNYNEKTGRPETSCDDLFISYNAYQDYVNCPTENFYAYYSELKQWANMEKEDVVVQDIKEKAKYYLGEECSVENNYLNPIEIYAYYIGMYINNMRNGIYLKYIMSFPVKYSKATKELIRKSFEKGLRKSLPNTIVEDAELMSKFSVAYQISEPAAYAVTALEQSGFKPKDETEKYLYGIFDFGGGTTDFDFGVWRGANDEEYDKFNCDYVLECFGADSDVRLGGENILEMLAYQVFKNNKNMAAEKKIACALPVDQTPFIGGEHLINNSQSANRNLTLLKEAFRPLWEQHDNWEEKYCKKNHGKSKEADEIMSKEEFIEIQMYDFNGKPVPNCRFNIDTQQLLELIKQRIQRGVDAFFKCIEKSILGNRAAKFASEKIYIFLAGNSCKSVFVKEIFQNTIKEYNKGYGEIISKEQDRFVLIDPLKSIETDYQYIPNAKTSVAYGLVKSRPGGKIYVRKNYETDSNEETRFKYYLGSDRRSCFVCKLAPMIKNESNENQTSYNVWHKFQGAGMGVARIYYTEDPRADSKAEDLAIDNIPFHEILFDAEEDKYLFIRAIRPSVIEYAIANSVEEIADEDIKELDIDKK
ncbi:MAG: hypothetical protein HFG57_07155 [Lachnospiraceae bacterium]|nr:hypothetical protein [Lachnospiraceae bacterium]